jgi:hypothetical protein
MRGRDDEREGGTTYYNTRRDEPVNDFLDELR